MLLYMFQDKLLYFPSMPPNARTAFVPAHLYNLQNVRCLQPSCRLLDTAQIRLTDPRVFHTSFLPLINTGPRGDLHYDEGQH